MINKKRFCLKEFAKNELVTINFFILTGLNLTLEVFSQFFFWVFVITLFTAKHSSIKDIVMGSKEASVKIFKVNSALSFEAVTS